MSCRTYYSCLLLLAACSPSAGRNAEEAPFTSTTGGGQSNGGNGNFVASSGGGTGTGFVPVTTTPDPNVPEGSCGATRARAEQVVVPVEVEITETVPQPVALYLMLDQSGSMIENNKWIAAVNAINAFVNDPRSAGIKVALQMFSISFFPPSGCGICDGSDCKTPMVPLAVLPAASADVATALGRAPIGIGTPIEAGLRGGVDFCIQHQQATPNEKCVVVFISDGAPSTCVGDAVSLGNIASAAKTQHGVTTFTIGMVGADFLLMDAIARGGGSDCSPNAAGETCNASNNQDFLAALDNIRTSVVVTRTETRTEVVNKPVPCEFALPQPPPDQGVFDKAKVNMQFTAAGQLTKVLKANDLSECPPDGGWYYDNETTPTKLLVCPATCSVIQAAPDVDVSILLGCETTRIPR